MHLVFCVYSCAHFTPGFASLFLSIHVSNASTSEEHMEREFFLLCFWFFVHVQYYASLNSIIIIEFKLVLITQVRIGSFFRPWNYSLFQITKLHVGIVENEKC